MVSPDVRRQTRGTCNTCLKDVPAAVVVRDGDAVLEKTCPEHGMTEQLLSHHGEEWAELDRYYFRVNGESWPQRDYIVRMTETCNLDCPICLAKANTEDTPDLPLDGLEKLLTSRRGIKVDLMAAEPTLRADLEDWIKRVKEAGHIAALHTNGLRLADRAYAQRIKDAGVDEVFLQFDGFDEEAHMVLRGRPLVKARMKALTNLRELDIATSLIVVIAKNLNEPQVGEVLKFALQPANVNIREVFFLGLRLLGSARDAVTRGEEGMDDAALMPDEVLDLMCNQVPRIKRVDVRRFNKLYFAMLSAFKVKKCLYVQHYMLVRTDEGFSTIAELLDMEALDRAADRYAEDFLAHPRRARARLLAALARQALRPQAMRALVDFARLQQLFRSGMNLQDVPARFLLLGFITACDPNNYDSGVAINCGKGELSVDGGFIESGATANVLREARFSETALEPGTRRPTKG
jgi:sulfatase maturation enzyme AslB (radical SAM superfamily)